MVLALAGIASFDLGPPLALNDSYIYSWSVAHLTAGVIYPRQTALALPQLLIGWIVAVPFGHDQRALRASQLILIVAGAWAAQRIARRLGAGAAWSHLSPAVLVTSPIFFNVAVSFMSDVAYVALLLLACNAGVAWAEGNGGRAGFAAWATLATLQRVPGIGVIAALAIALIVRSRQSGRPLTRSDWLWLGASAAGSSLAIVVPTVVGTSAGANLVDRLNHFQTDALLTPFVHLPLLAGYLLLPLAGGLLIRWNTRAYVMAAAGAALLVLALGFVTWLPGNIWTFVGPAPTLPGGKSAPVPLTVQVVIVGLAAITFWLLWVASSADWIKPVAPDPRLLFLVLTAGLQLVLLLPNTVTFYDRYYLPVVAPLIPMICALAQTRGRPGAAWFATAACAALLVLSLVYQQDYQSWQSSRDQAARLAFLCAAPSRVNAGYEANAVYTEVPTYEATGRSLPARLVGRDVTVFGPANPALWLEFAGPDDKRPGVAYASVAPGKIVINGAICPAAEPKS